MKTEEKLAKLLREKRKENKCHMPSECAEGGCPNCNRCVDEWENLTDKEKELAILNSKAARLYFRGTAVPADLDKRILKIMDDNLRAGTAAEQLEGVICNRFATAGKIAAYVKRLMKKRKTCSKK
jgi:hypothetical protein